MNIIVTGGAGFVGSNLVKRLKNEGNNIVVIDNYSAGKHGNEIDGVIYFNNHTKDIFNIEIPFKPDVVFHLGEYSRIHPSFKEYKKVWEYNSIGTFQILTYCLENDIKIVYAGSSTKFAAEGINHSPYSFTKAMNVELVKSFSKWFGVKYSICYFYNVFGPGYDSSPIKGYESVISIFGEQYKNNKPLTVTGDGSQERMFTYVEDIADGLIKSYFYPQNEEFELGNPIKSYSILEIAKMFSDNIEFIDSRKGDRTDSVLTNYKETCDKLNWLPTISVEEWIKKLKNKVNGK